mmetsp:Transcript_54584/g.99735  ORF Transcript_54584/g.99735 Transcript_54584/m.99735 type:complete len:146 (-) Transcript_54584:30-467(-)
MGNLTPTICQCEKRDEEAATINENPGPGAELVQLPVVVQGTVVDRSLDSAKDSSDQKEELTGLAALQGVWCRDIDQQPMGMIKGEQMIWDDGYQHPPSPMKCGPNGEIQMELFGTTHRARLTDNEDGSGRAKLRWSDGEVWIRIA